MRWTATSLLLAAAVAAAPAAAAEAGGAAVEVTKAWTPAVQARGDAPIYMTITNRGDAPDSLVRARCPTDLADFTEKYTTDRGEGGLSAREVKTIAIPAGDTTFAPDGTYLKLLHLRGALEEGRTFTCSVVFQKAGTVPVEVRVAADGAK